VAEARSTASATADEPTEIAGPARPRPAGKLARRWPTALALAVCIPALVDPIGPDGIRTFAAAMLLLPLWYVVIAAVGRRSWTWPVLVGGIGLFILLQLQERVEPAAVLAGLALAGVLWGSIRGRLAQPAFLLQVAGLIAFGALAATGLLVAPDLGRYVVAAGWFGHGIWDFAHHRANAGVARSGAEWCGVVDVLVAAQLVALPLVL
jgi:hypothetical protein